MNQLISYSLQIDILCICIFLLIAFNLLKSGEKTKQLYISVIAIVLVQCFSTGVVTYMHAGNCMLELSLKLPCVQSIKLIVFFTCLNNFMAVFTSYIIFVITYQKRKDAIRSKDIKLFLLSLPFIIITYFIITSPFNGYIQFLTFGGNFVPGRFYSLLIGSIGFYSVLGIINFLSIMVDLKKRFSDFSVSLIDRILLYLTVSVPFIIAPANLLLHTNYVSVAYAISFFYLMTLHQHMRISIDDLTTLNNRNELKSYLNSLMSLSESQRKNTFMMFIDLNKFKHINDNFGHNEGDVVLIEISKLLKYVADTFNCFLCRYGGDEFILIKRNSDEEKAISVCSYIDKAVNDLSELVIAPYELSVSTGFVRFDSRFNSVQEFIDAADKLMYENKRSSKKDYSRLTK